MEPANVNNQASPDVSVITPVYNAEAVLARAVASVQAQSVADWELILIEDSSTDGSLALCRSLAAQDARIRLLQQPQNTGAAAARNAGLKVVQGRYVAFLDADDEWAPEKLARQLEFMRARQAVFSYTGFWRENSDGRRRVRVPHSIDRATLLKGNVVGCLTAMYDRAFFGEMQMPDIRMRQDFGFWLYLLTRTDLAHGLDEPLATHYVQSGSLSASRVKSMKANWHLYHTHLGFSAPRAAWYLGNHLIRRVKRG